MWYVALHHSSIASAAFWGTWQPRLTAPLLSFRPKRLTPKSHSRVFKREKCTALYGVPTMFVAELELLQNGIIPHTGFEHLRTGIAAGSSIPAELMRKLHKTLNLTELTICYGMTETSPVSAMTTTDDPLEKRIDSVGRLLPHVKAKVVDPADRTKVSSCRATRRIGCKRLPRHERILG